MTPERITCVCPQCRRAYSVLAKVSGRRARCRSCGMIFRVADAFPPPPSEDDILTWLSEAEEDDEATAERSPRTASASTV
jgi:rubredoxin